jgi:hypothetical protein
MRLFINHHNKVEGLTAEAVAGAHKREQSHILEDL